MSKLILSCSLGFMFVFISSSFGQSCNQENIFDVATSLETGRVPTSVESADLDNDGHIDVVTANAMDGDVSVFMNNGDGTLAARVDYDSNPSPLSCAIGDIDADGFLDIVVANSDLLNFRQVSVLYNRGDGTFDSPVSFQVGAFPQSVQLADFNGDGYIDVATANPSDNSISVLLNILGITFLEHERFDVDGFFPVDIVAGDVDGDGDTDLVSTNFNSGEIRVMRNNSFGSFNRSQRVILGNDTSGIDIGDLDSDGDLDLVVVNADEDSSDDIVVLKNSGAGVFSATQYIALDNSDSSEVYKVSIGDLDGDGDLDFVTADGFNNTVSISLNNGDAGFTQPTLLQVGQFARDVHLADLNNDGKLDILEVDRDDQTLNIFNNMCDPITCSQDLNQDGALNFFDVSAFISALTNQDPIADFNNDKHFNFFDVSAFLTSFAAGCP